MARTWKTVFEFIGAHTIDKGCEYTHTSLLSPAVSFYVPADHQEAFYKLYEQAINNKDDLYITEKNRHIGPLVIDLDFRFKPQPQPQLQLQLQPQQPPIEQSTSDAAPAAPVRQYSPELIRKVVHVYATELAKLINMADNTTFYVMEKSSPSICKNLIKDGIHIVVPEAVAKASVKHLLRQAVMPLLKPIMEKIGSINPIEDIVDESIIERNNWFMYGSKKRGSEPYVVTRVFVWNRTQHKVKEKDLGEIQPSYDFRLFSIRNKHKETQIKVEATDLIEEFEQKQEETKRNMSITKKIVGVDQNNRHCIVENIEEVERLIDLLSIKRVDKYDDWIRLGWCLRNIDDRLVTKWESFSAQSPKYRAGECTRLWCRMKEGSLGIGSLHMWARADNPEEYGKIMQNDLRHLLYQSASMTHYDIAKVVHHMYKQDFVCGSYKNRFWYEFRNHRWNVTDSGLGLRMKLSDEVWKTYKHEGIEFTQKAIQAVNQADRDRYDDFSKKMNEISTKLRNSCFKENIMKECSELFYVEKFEDKLDANTHIIGFQNGVYDLERQEFRDGRPDDFITFCTGTNWIEYNEHAPVMYDIHEYLTQVLTVNAVKEYVLKLFATFISGQVKEQKFYIWTGSGSNSKSKLVELFEKSFGDYCCKFPVTMLTGKRVASNAANSELARAKGKRFACLQEPSEDEHINIGLMKELSGGDKIMARALYKEPFEFCPQFKMLLLCNHLPHVPSDDGGTWRRIRVVEFRSKFCDNPDPTNPLEFPIDYDLSDKMDDWREHFCALLIHYYKKYQVEGITEPADVMQCTIDYKSQNDHMAHFIITHIEKKDTAFLTIDEAHVVLRNWIKDDSIPIKLMSKPDFEKHLIKTLGKCVLYNHMKGFKGYRLKTVYAPGEEAVAETEVEVESE